MSAELDRREQVEDALDRLLLWIEDTQLLRPDASTESLRPEAVAEIEGLVEAYVSLASAARCPSADVLPVKTRIVSDFADIASVAPALEPADPFVLTWRMVDACSELREVLHRELDQDQIGRIVAAIEWAQRPNFQYPAETGHRLIPGYLVAIYDALWSLGFADLASPFAPLVAIWELGAWPMIRSDQEVIVFIPRGKIQAQPASQWYDAILWNPLVASGLTAFTSPFWLQMAEASVQLSPRLGGRASKATENFYIAGEVSIGRDPSSDIALRGGNMTWKHAKLNESDGGWWVTDLDSTNGTFVGGSRIEGTTNLRERPIGIGDWRLEVPNYRAGIDQLSVLLKLRRGVGADPRTSALVAKRPKF